MASVVGIGNPLMDFIMHSSYQTLDHFNAKPGTMHLVERPVVDSILSFHKDPMILAGGSAANTLRGLAWLCEQSCTDDELFYFGAVGKDDFGDAFQNILKDQGVNSYLGRKETPTGVSGILVTPDFERTMFTFLGACRDFSEADLDLDIVCSARYIYIAGYMWDTENQKKSITMSVKSARSCGVQVAFDLADPFVICRSGEELKKWIPGNVDILFANVEELSMMADMKAENKEGYDLLLKSSESLAPIIVMKTGAAGCKILYKDKIISVPGNKVKPLDTTAAGDSFAGGFLYGMLREYSPSECGRLANLLASRIVTVEGCNYAALEKNTFNLSS